MSFLAILEAFISIMLPGFFLSLGLLKKTKLSMFEIVIFGFIFGIIFPPTMIWLESYLINYYHGFTFSTGLYNINVLVLTVVGVLLCIQQKAFSKDMAANPGNERTRTNSIYWYVLAFLMLVTFTSRIVNISAAPTFFEFDSYFDMQSTEYILVHGYQLLYDHSAWPTLVNGTYHRIEPVVPYLEAYWYQISSPKSSAIDINLLSSVSSVYPAIMAALLVFIIFLFIFYEYGEFPAIIGAALATAMPALITTFIAGEQLLEPWGIFAMFLFYASYLLAVKNPKELRFSILAAIAYISTFLGAHYYTVTAGVLAIYLAMQVIVNVFKQEDNKDFFKSNALMIGIIALFYLLYEPYNSVLVARTPGILGIPVIISFPLLALLFGIALDYGTKFASKTFTQYSRNIITASLLGALILFGVLMTLFGPLNGPVSKYIALSTHFTTPSIPLFMTVQEYTPTGIGFNFGANGFGIIGASIAGIPITVWLVLAVFVVLSLSAVYYRNSKLSILSLAAVGPLAVAGMIEVKYLPHFGVGYIIAVCAIMGEILLFVKNNYRFTASEGSESSNINLVKGIYAFAIVLTLVEALSLVDVFGAALNHSCYQNSTTAIGANMYCNQVQYYWLKATDWMKANVGPFAPRILSWWDYGDWINWFGNSNAVLRGDNAVATLDYATAAQYVFSNKDGYNASTVARFMDSIQAKYLLLDDQLMQKWEALDFLACIHANQTSLQFAKTQGQQVGTPYRLGKSNCELNHDPIYAVVPIPPEAIGRPGSLNASAYCQISNNTNVYYRTYFVQGLGTGLLLNSTYCVPSTIFTAQSNKPIKIYNDNGTLTNAVIIPNLQFYYGPTQGPFGISLVYMVAYLPEGANATINAPTEFYDSNFYRAFMFGKLDGFSLAYPSNFTGINYINSTNQVVILKLNNYSAGNPPVTAKFPWISNNYSMPG